MKPLTAMVGIFTSAVSFAAVAAPEWEYSEDIPHAQPVAIGLAGEKPVDIVRFLMARSASAPSLSPDGRWLAFSASITGSPQLWVVPTTGGWPKQLTFGGGITFHAWSPAGDILYGADNAGDEREGYYLISPDGERERQVRPASNAFLSFGGFSHDGQYIVYATTERNGRDFDIHKLAIDSGTDSRLFEGHFGFFAQDWQPNGPWIIVTEPYGEDAEHVYLLNADSKEMKTLFKPADGAAHNSFAWAPDGSGFYLATNQGREYTGLAFYRIESGQLEWLESPNHDIEDVNLSSDGRYLAWSTNEGGYSHIHAKDLQSNRAIAPPPLPPGVYNMSFAHHAPVMAIAVTGPRIPGDIWRWDLTNGASNRITHAATAGIALDDLVVPEAVSFAARDGITIHGLLYLPNERLTKPPVVVTVHGGPTAQARPRFQSVAQYLVGKGIAVLDINVRGSTGYGKTYTRLDNQRKRLDSVRDLADTVAWMRTDGRVDADRAAVMGGSYGGYMTNAVLVEYPKIFKAGVSFVGVSDWVRALEEASPGLKASDRIEYGDISDPEVRAYYSETSPMVKIGDIVAPIMVLHGANDPRDPIAESDRMVKAIRAQGKTATYLRFPDEGHGIRKLANRVTAYRRVADFLETQLGLQALHRSTFESP